jgi:predicted SnoaL-like aldol condensation-catalyzing enzyme
MMMMKHIYLMFFLLLGVVLVCMGQPSKLVEDYRKQINQKLQTGNADALSAFFRDMVELSINHSAETYSKAQTASILTDFFRENPPAQFTEMDTWKDGDVVHVIGDYLSTQNAAFRIHYAMQKSETKEHSKKSSFWIYSIYIEQTKKCKKPNASAK